MGEKLKLIAIVLFVVLALLVPVAIFFKGESRKAEIPQPEQPEQVEPRQGTMLKKPTTPQQVPVPPRPRLEPMIEDRPENQ